MVLYLDDDPINQDWTKQTLDGDPDDLREMLRAQGLSEEQIDAMPCFRVPAELEKRRGGG